MNEICQDLIKVQQKCLEILKVIDDLCRKNGIQYSLTGGSVIGYHLYQGFIPWDDDIDLMMTRENYHRFLKVCNTQLDKKYSVHNIYKDNDGISLHTKIIDETTTVVEKTADGCCIISGVFVDITCFDYSDEYGKAGKLDNLLLIQIRNSSSYSYTNKQKPLYKRMVGRMVSIARKQLYQLVEKRLYTKSKIRKTPYMAEILFGLTIAYDADLMSCYNDVVFEGVTAMLVEDYMLYLKTRYGRTEFYRENRGDEPHHYVLVDLTKPYKKQNLNTILAASAN